MVKKTDLAIIGALGLIGVIVYSKLTNKSAESGGIDAGSAVGGAAGGFVGGAAGSAFTGFAQGGIQAGMDLGAWLQQLAYNQGFYTPTNSDDSPITPPKNITETVKINGQDITASFPLGTPESVIDQYFLSIGATPRNANTPIPIVPPQQPITSTFAAPLVTLPISTNAKNILSNAGYNTTPIRNASQVASAINKAVSNQSNTLNNANKILSNAGYNTQTSILNRLGGYKR